MCTIKRPWTVGNGREGTHHLKLFENSSIIEMLNNVGKPDCVQFPASVSRPELKLPDLRKEETFLQSPFCLGMKANFPWFPPTQEISLATP